MLFKRYASPFLFVDQMILSGQFEDFAEELPEWMEHEKLWDFWLHKVFNADQSFEQWKESVLHPQDQTVSDEEIEATVQKTMTILHGFEI